jgi:hypothetical protein
MLTLQQKLLSQLLLSILLVPILWSSLIKLFTLHHNIVLFMHLISSPLDWSISLMYYQFLSSVILYKSSLLLVLPALILSQMVFLKLILLLFKLNINVLWTLLLKLLCLILDQLIIRINMFGWLLII